MPFCPECQAEYEDGVATCTDCEVPLVAALPEREPPDTGQGEPVPFRSFANYAEASMVANFLAENDVRAFVSGGEFTVVPSSFADEIVLMVDERDMERARQLHEAFFGQSGAQEPGDSEEFGEDASAPIESPEEIDDTDQG